MATDVLSEITGVVTVAEWTSWDSEGNLLYCRKVNLPNSTVNAALERLRGASCPVWERFKVIDVQQTHELPGATTLVITYGTPKKATEVPQAETSTGPVLARRAECCEEGRLSLRYGKMAGSEAPAAWRSMSCERVTYCPHCGQKLEVPSEEPACLTSAV